MSTGLLERVDTESKIAEDSDLDHIVCHCDLTKGWCGAPTDGLAIEGDSENPCPDCEAIVLQDDETCPYGCSCPASLRYWYCGIDDMWDDEEDEDE